MIYHVCPKLESRYASVIGVYENRAHYLELQILELKRRIEMMQAAINRAKAISMEQMEDQIRKEYQAFHDKVEEERKKAEQNQKSQREKEAKKQEFRKAWEEKYGKSKSGVPSEDADQEGQKEQEKVAILSETKPMGRSQEITGKRVRIRLQILRICTGRL